MLFMILNMTLSIIFLFLNHPMTLGLTLLIQTMLIALITGMLNTTFWFSYILFLIMVGGMLVLFIYMTSIASNEMFSYSNSIMIYMSIIFISSIFIYLIMDFYMININFIYLENMFFHKNNYSITKFFNYPSIMIIFMMIIYLFITLIAVVKITKIEYGPLRQKF
uniref:NADH-ubiquinone oxidoreductase chain 6 n=1 Tax=Atheta gagatina TaxID=866029 RepID=A0A0S2M6S4_9COLE|nr:NADH deshydrogenase subunit 6 [Atheta gagatina]